jgi:hypothetical protein
MKVGQKVGQKVVRWVDLRELLWVGKLAVQMVG